MKSIIAGNVKKIIREQGYKQAAIAIKAGYAPAKFSNMLNSRKLIADYDIPQIANALGVTPNELFEQSNDQSNA